LKFKRACLAKPVFENTDNRKFGCRKDFICIELE